MRDPKRAVALAVAGCLSLLAAQMFASTAAVARIAAGGAGAAHQAGVSYASRQVMHHPRVNILQQADAAGTSLASAEVQSVAPVPGFTPACYGDSRSIAPVSGSNQTLNPVSFGAFYNCVQKTWTFEVQTQDTWARNSLGDWQVSIDTDGNLSDNCSGNEYLAFLAQQSVAGTFAGQVEAVNSSCRPVGTPVTLPGSFLTITTNSVALTFPSSAIGSANTLVWTGQLQNRTEEVTSGGGDLVPSPTSLDSFIEGAIADSIFDPVPPNPVACTAAGTFSPEVATTPDSHRAASVLRKAGFGQVHDYGLGIVSFTGERAAAQSVLEAAGLGTQVAPGHAFEPATVTSPNDPAFTNGSQWNLGVIGASGGSGAWSVTNGSGVIVADIDTGVDYTQPDLVATVGLTSATGTSPITSLAVSPVVQTIASGATITVSDLRGHADSFTTSAAVAVGATSIPVIAQTPSFNYPIATRVIIATNLLRGYDTITQTAMGPGTSEPGNTDKGQLHAGHGTAVAGVLAALTNNGTGLASLGFNTKVLPIKVNFDDQADIAAQLAAGINWAADATHTLHPSFPVKVINLSLSGPCADPSVLTAIQNAQAAGILVVAAAGDGALNSTLDPNHGANDIPAFPADLSGVIGVGATGRDGFRAAYSDTGSYVSMAAPGGSAIPGQPGNDLPLLAPGDQCPVPPCFTTGAGTSFAAPQVSAAAALIWSANPTRTASQVSELLKSTTTDQGVSGIDLAYGTGMENASVALADTPPTTPGYGTYVNLPQPFRILDTRDGTGLPNHVPAPVGPGGILPLTVTGLCPPTGSPCPGQGIPTGGVAAVVLNVTITGPTAASFLTVWPDGQLQPNSSNLNFAAKDTRPNLVIVKVPSDGKVDIFNAAGTVQVIADIAGYYVDGTGSPGSTFQPCTPSRILDTRSSPPAVTGTPRLLSVTGQSCPTATKPGATVPSTATGAVLNVTVTGPTASSNLTVYPANMPTPLASNLNFSPGQTVPNLVYVGLGNGGINLVNAAGSAQVIIDLEGYFTAAAKTDGSRFFPVVSHRILDTRANIGGTIPNPIGPVGPNPPNPPLGVGVTGAGGVLDGAANVIMNTTVTAPTAGSFLTVFPSDLSSPPNTSNLNFVASQTVANLVSVAIGLDGKDKFYNPVGTVQVIADVEGWYGTAGQ